MSSVQTDPAYTLKTLMPFGPLLENSPGNFYTLFNHHRAIPAASQAANISAHPGMYTQLDQAFVNEFSYEHSAGYARPRLSFFPYFAIMNNENEFVSFIKEQRDILQRSPIKDSAFVYGPITTFWAVFTELDSYLNILLGIGTGIIFICTLLFFSFDIVTAVITSASCLMIVLEIYGFAVYCFNFNVFVAAVCLMALGLSVEFTAHLAAAFSLGSGTVAERLVNAMAHTFPALIEGTVSTFLSIVPLAFHTVPFAVKYLFWIVFMVVVVGFVNGALFMPSLLSLLSSILSLGGRGLRRNESASEGSARKPVAGSASTRGDEAGADQLPTIMQPSSQDNGKPQGAASV
jgi:hypothetical protein